ncbi:MAG: carboxypeptidase M32 [Halobacteriales archaeon]
MATDTTPDPERVYADFEDRVKKIYNVGAAQSVLGWDQQVMMPEGGTPARSKQLSTLSSIEHDLVVADETGDLIEELTAVEEALTADQRAVLREISRRYERATRVPTDLVERISETTSSALPVWKEAKAEDDFDSFASTLEELIELKREYAEHIDPDRDPYEVLFEDYEPYLDLETAERILERLRDELVPLIEEIRASDTDMPAPFEGTYDTDVQEELAREALSTLGYPWDRGRLDTAPHPFSTGTMFDARVTTRFDESDPLGALTSTIHEFGHATYNLGLPEEAYATPLGDSRDMTVHESQSRLWENHVGRSEAFWELFTPTVSAHFPSVDRSPAEMYAAANRIYPDNMIRVEADELTYHLHIILRFEIERDLIHGDLDVAEVPPVWNDKMEEYLGIRPATDTEGCLQDIHWSHASFGYFPTYSLGSVLAAQLYRTAESAIDGLEESIREGEFEPLHEWLTANIHRHGCRYTTPELIEEATGESFSADYFLEYATTKYTDLYRL